MKPRGPQIYPHKQVCFWEVLRYIINEGTADIKHLYGVIVDPIFVFECCVRIAPAIKNGGVDIHLISDDFCL